MELQTDWMKHNKIEQEMEKHEGNKGIYWEYDDKNKWIHKTGKQQWKSWVSGKTDTREKNDHLRDSKLKRLVSYKYGKSNRENTQTDPTQCIDKNQARNSYKKLQNNLKMLWTKKQCHQLQWKDEKNPQS